MLISTFDQQRVLIFYFVYYMFLQINKYFFEKQDTRKLHLKIIY